MQPELELELRAECSSAAPENWRAQWRVGGGVATAEWLSV